MEIIIKIIISFIIFKIIQKYIKNNLILFLSSIYLYKYFTLEITFTTILTQLPLIIILEIIIQKYNILKIDEIELIKKGKLNFKNLQKLDIKIEELLNKLQYTNIEDIELCTIDYKKKLNITLKKNLTPIPIIVNSKIEFRNIILIKKNIEWLKQTLIKKNLTLEEIFYAFYYNENFVIITNSNIDKETNY